MFLLPLACVYGETSFKGYFVKEDQQEPQQIAAPERDEYYEECCEECCCEPCCVPRECMNGVYVVGEYLFWGTWQDGLAIAGKGCTYPGKIKNIDFDWVSGFRAGVGAHFCDQWTFDARYTYLRPEGKEKICADEIFPIFIPQFVAGGFSFDVEGALSETSTSESEFNSVCSKIRFDYNILDVELRRNVSCYECFVFEVIAGAQGAWVGEKFKNIFQGNLTVTGLASGIALDETLPTCLAVNQKWEFEGGGIKVGAEGTARSCCGLLLYGGGRFNVLFGRYQNRYTQEILDLSTSTTAPVYNTLFTQYYTVNGKEKFCDFVSNFQFGLGFGFEGNCGCFYTRLKAGWEMDYWIDLAQFRNGLSGKATDSSQTNASIHFSNTNVTDKVARNIGLQGLVVSLELKF